MRTTVARLLVVMVSLGGCSSNPEKQDVTTDVSTADTAPDGSFEADGTGDTSSPDADLTVDASFADKGDVEQGWWNVYPLEKIVAGVAEADITPVFETYTDSNGNGHWDDGEPINDTNTNGKLDSLEMGGFGWRHPTGVLHPLTSRALALRVDGEWFVLVAVDSLGIGIQRSENIKDKALALLGPGFELDKSRIVVACIHTHSAPDTMGIFGEEGVNPEYIVMLEDRSADAVANAIKAVKPARIGFSSVSVTEAVRDIDPPEILDPYVGIIVVKDANDHSVVATLVSIANHPETFWAENTLITPDFPHYLRLGLASELGGMGFYFSSNAGLMQSPTEIAPHGEERAQAIAQLYLDAVVPAAKDVQILEPEATSIQISARTITTALENFSLYVGLVDGQIDGFDGWLHKTTEPPCDVFGCFDLPVVIAKIGTAMTIVSLPGEFVPELVVGGITLPEVFEGPYGDAPDEPLLKDHLVTDERFVIGLANMDCGYVYSKKNHDPSNHFSQQHAPGPNAAMVLMTGIAEMLDEMK